MYSGALTLITVSQSAHPAPSARSNSTPPPAQLSAAATSQLPALQLQAARHATHERSSMVRANGMSDPPAAVVSTAVAVAVAKKTEVAAGDAAPPRLYASSAMDLLQRACDG